MKVRLEQVVKKEVTPSNKQWQGKGGAPRPQLQQEKQRRWKDEQPEREEELKKVWIRDEEHLWVLGYVLSETSLVTDSNNQKKIAVLSSEDNQEYQIPLDEVHPYDFTHDQDLENLADMDNLHEAPLLYLLRKRYMKDLIYTFTGDILISINPYKRMHAYYAIDVAKPNISSHKLSSPHVYVTAERAYNSLQKYGKCQSIIVTGESGAGKTEASKYIMRYLAKISEEKRQKATALDTSSMSSIVGSSVEECMLKSNPLLEAFGNAKTIRNDNSSRFGKFMKIHYNLNGIICGASISHFLLEKSRIVGAADNERNYHIFYLLCDGASKAMKADLFLKSVDEYNYLNRGVGISPDINDEKQYQTIVEAMNVLGISVENQQSVWTLLATVLNLGNIDFLKNEKGEAFCSSLQDIEGLAKLLNVQLNDLQFALCKRTMRAGGRGSFAEIALTVDQALESKNGLSKAMYSAVFDWLVLQVNDATASLTNSRQEKSSSFIGILDIFGFEILQTNSFEQLCINFANEMLQQQFNRCVFVYEQNLYKEEGIDWSVLEFQDNQACLDLIQAKPHGILPLLDEQAILGRRASDFEFIQKLHQLHANNHNYSRPRFSHEEFVVHHYAGEVTYNVCGFLDKNNDSLHTDLVQLMNRSQNPLIKMLFPPLSVAPQKYRREACEKSSTKMTGSMTVGRNFRDQMSDLMLQLDRTDPWYVRCIKPNNDRSRNGWNGPLILAQLRYLGVLETVRIRRSGFPIRRPFHDFVNEYGVLVRKKLLHKERMSKREECLILTTLLDPKNCQVGHRKVFLRDGQLQILDGMITKLRETCAVTIQKTVRMMLTRSEFKLMRTSVATIQKWWHKVLMKLKYQHLLLAATRIQSRVRTFSRRRTFWRLKSACIVIQQFRRRYQRRLLCIRICKIPSAQKKISSTFRMFLKRRDYIKMLKTIVTCQSLARRHLKQHHFTLLKRYSDILKAKFLCRKYSEKYRRVQRSSILLHAIVRGFLVRIKYGKKARVALVREINARNFLSLVLYTHAIRTKYRRYRKSIILLQAMNRRNAQFRDFLRMKNACIILQARARTYLHRRWYLQHKRAATTISHFFQMLLTRRLYRKIIGRAIHIQATFRRYTSQRWYQRIKKAVVSIQAMQRCVHTFRKFHQKKKQICKVQAFGRMILAKVNLLRARNAVTCLATHWRRYKARNEYLRQISHVVHIQSVIRSFNCRKRFLMIRNQIIRVQANVRVLLERRRRARRMFAVLRLQIAGRAWARRVRLRLKIRNMFEAAERYDLAAIHDLAQELPDMLQIRQRNRQMMSLAHVAALNGDLNLARLLLDEHRLIDQIFCVDLLGNTPLHYACITGHFDMVTYIAHMANIYASTVNTTEEFDEQHLLKRMNAKKTCFAGANINSAPTNNDHLRQTRRLKSICQSTEKIPSRAVVQEGYLRNPDDGKWTFTRKYVVMDNATLAIYKAPKDILPLCMLELNGLTVQRNSTYDFCLTLYSNQLRSQTNPKGFINLAADSEKATRQWISAFREINGVCMRTTERPSKSLVRMNKKIMTFLINNRNEAGMSPLHCAVMNDDEGLDAVKISAWLIEFGASLSARDSDDNTPLHLASKRKRTDLIQTLVKKGADFTCQNRKNETCLDVTDDEKIKALLVKSSDRASLLHPPLYIKNGYYLALFLESIHIIGSATMDAPFLKVYVVNKKNNRVESAQETPSALIQEETSLWWGNMWHMQTPIEYLTKGCSVVIELYRAKRSAFEEMECFGWTFFSLNFGQLVTGPLNLSMYIPPANPCTDVLARVPGEATFHGTLNVISDSN